MDNDYRPPKDYTKKDPHAWIIQGLAWGAFMFLMMELIFPLIDKEEIIFSNLIKGGVVWLVGGLAFGIVMRKISK